MTFSAVGTRTTSPANATTASGASITPTAVGDLIVWVGTTANTNHCTGLSSTNTTGWAEVPPSGGVVDTTNAETLQMFWGLTSAASAATVTPSWSQSILTGNSVCWNLLMFHSTVAGVWALDASGSADVTAASTTLTGVTLAPTGGNTDLYVTMFGTSNAGTAGTTSGFVWPANDFYNNVMAYNLAVTGSVTPVASQSPSGVYERIAALFSCNLASTNPPRPIPTQHLLVPRQRSYNW